MRCISCLFVGIFLAPFIVVPSVRAADSGANSNASLNLELTVQPGCTIYFGNGASVVFPEFTFLSSPVTEQGDFTVVCTAGYGKAIDVSLNGGSVNPSDQVNARKLYLDGKPGHNSFDFQIYIGNSPTIIWGDGTQGTQVYRIPADSVNNIKQLYPFTAVLPRQSTEGKVVGKYSNIFTVTFKY